MTTVVDSYQQLNASSETEGDDDNEERPHDSNLIIHVVPESEKSRWNHIEDLDSFFTRMYYYHQKHGFICMILQEVFELVQFVYVIFFSIFLLHGLDYSILFEVNKNKTSLSDAFLPLEQWITSMGFITWSSVLFASIFWFFRLIKFFCHVFQYWDIKNFYNLALKITDSDLDNLTWHEVQKKIIEVQKEQEMCIHKRELTELDIHHRILRFKNYLVAMINKSLLPLKFQVPLFGEVIFLTQGLKYNLELLFFWGPWSPFENNWHLQEDYKKSSKRQELATFLSKQILWIGIVNIILCPVIFLWRILYSFFNYGELLKREPGILGIRTWSLYAKLYLRHFNELDHELNARLNRAYRPASKYMSMFTSPMTIIIAKNIAFICGSIFVVLVILTCYDEDFLNVEHVLLMMTIAGTIAAICRSLIPDENLVWCPETVLTAVLAHTHYRPDNWRRQAHTHTTRTQFSHLFKYRAVHLLEELISPLITPYILCFRLRYKTLDIVDFYRNFTIEVIGVGDVCSFAQMDIRKHGNPRWQIPDYSSDEALKIKTRNLNSEQKDEKIFTTNEYNQAEDGKTELSLIHFTLTNPEWIPPAAGEIFVRTLCESAKTEVTNIGVSKLNSLIISLESISNLGPKYNEVVSSIIRSSVVNNIDLSNNADCFDNPQHMEEISPNGSFFVQNSPSDTYSIHNIICDPPKVIRKGASRAEGPLYTGERSLLLGLQHLTGASSLSFSVSAIASVLQNRETTTSALEFTTIDMSLSTLYLHELHHKYVEKKPLPNLRASSGESFQRSPRQQLEALPEFGRERAPLLYHPDSSIKN
ncbi:autophagy-related protein 9A [Copidosoma floridanum]|uniref:autophagy-related protein 9A n=1 Tax=Copidosoma floridanum TaxID=29053 RepID=UPI000C6F4502|nr:autophagy-related protein 9A [Copidosoma floridanum]